MEPHAVPRQITTFEFKLIGFLTLKEFAYLVVFAGFAAIAYFTAPFELAKYISAGIVFGSGAFLAFFKYNDRSIDVWIKNLVIKLFSSSQYYYHKHAEPPSFLRDITYDKQIATLHVDAKKKLSSYQQRPTNATLGVTPKVTNALEPEIVQQAMPVEPEINVSAQSDKSAVSDTSEQSDTPIHRLTDSPIVLSGLIKNSKDLPLPNILLYVKNKDGQVARILKTNSHGVFSTTRPLGADTYILEPKDSNNRFFFDTININPSSAQLPLIIRSKEVL